MPSEPPLELTTPYLERDLFALDLGTQSADVLWVFHPNYPPAVVERLSANSWAYSFCLCRGRSRGKHRYRGTLDVVKTGYSALGQSSHRHHGGQPLRGDGSDYDLHLRGRKPGVHQPRGRDGGIEPGRVPGR